MAWSATVDPLVERLATDPSSLMGLAGNAGVDSQTRALARVSALVCIGGTDTDFQRFVGDAIRVGATPEQVLGAFLCVASLAGEPRVVAAAPKVARALGYDVETEFEHG